MTCAPLYTQRRSRRRRRLRLRPRCQTVPPPLLHSAPDPERPSTRINPNLRRIQRRRSFLPPGRLARSSLSPLSPLKKSNLCRTSKSTFALYFRSRRRRRRRRHVSQSATSYFRFASPARSCLFQAPPFVNERGCALLLLSVPYILLESRGRVKDMRFVTRLTHPST